MSSPASLLIFAIAAMPCALRGQATRLPLSTTDRLRADGTVLDTASFKGSRAVRVAIDPVVARKPEYLNGSIDPEELVLVDGVAFANGVIEVEVASAPAEGAGPGARGFAGIAFRVQPIRSESDRPTYDAFYMRPTNGRADDQERRNHSVQYISHPDWTWSRLRQETPSRYEAYVDLEPNTWTKLRIEVRGDKARLYVHGQMQPTMIVNDVKSGTSASGGVALWIGPGTVAYFRNLVVTPE